MIKSSWCQQPDHNECQNAWSHNQSTHWIALGFIVRIPQAGFEELCFVEHFQSNSVVLPNRSTSIPQPYHFQLHIIIDADVYSFVLRIYGFFIRPHIGQKDFHQIWINISKHPHNFSSFWNLKASLTSSSFSSFSHNILRTLGAMITFLPKDLWYSPMLT